MFVDLKYTYLDLFISKYFIFLFIYRNFIKFELISVYIVGHSMGGKIALDLCLNYPRMFEAVSILDISPLPYIPDK